MCDYSLMSVPNRLAREGEELMTHRFPTGCIGLAAHSDLHPEPTRPSPGPRTLWTVVKQFLNGARTKPIPAVCIPPGARLLMDVQEQWQPKARIIPGEEVTFTQITAAANSYRDAIRLSNGREILLQRLVEGLRVRVLSLGPNDGIASAMQEDFAVRVRS